MDGHRRGDPTQSRVNDWNFRNVRSDDDGHDDDHDHDHDDDDYHDDHDHDHDHHHDDHDDDDDHDHHHDHHHHDHDDDDDDHDHHHDHNDDHDDHDDDDQISFTADLIEFANQFRIQGRRSRSRHLPDVPGDNLDGPRLPIWNPSQTLGI